MRLGLMLAASLGLVGCASIEASDGAATDDFIDMDTPPTNCSAGTAAEPCPDPSSGGAPEGGACRESNDCEGGNACVAPFVDGEVGDFVCTSQCIPLMDESSWCLDAGACCGVGVVCSARGLCVEGALDDSGTAADSGSGTAADDGGSMGTAGSGGSESSGSDGSATGGSTGTTGGGAG